MNDDGSEANRDGKRTPSANGRRGEGTNSRAGKAAGGNDNAAAAAAATSTSNSDSDDGQNGAGALPTGTDSPWLVDAQHAVSYFRAAVKRQAFTMLIAFRGQFCRYCRAYAMDIVRHLDSVRRDGGNVILMSSERLERSEQISRDWGLAESRVPVISDTNHELATSVGFFIDSQHLMARTRQFPHGMVQPGVLVVDRSGRKLYMWRSNPNLANLSGATGRPLPDSVAQEAERKMNDSDDNDGVGGRKPVKIKYTSAMAIFRCC